MNDFNYYTILRDVSQLEAKNPHQKTFSYPGAILTTSKDWIAFKTWAKANRIPCDLESFPEGMAEVRKEDVELKWQYAPIGVGEPDGWFNCDLIDVEFHRMRGWLTRYIAIYSPKGEERESDNNFFCHDFHYQANATPAIKCDKQCESCRQSNPSPKDEQGEWISVEERLPELGRDVIAYRVSEGEEYPLIIRWNKYYSKDEFTHWMPLPEPPKAK